MIDELYFLTRYIPFWAVPILLISLECAYLSWIRKKKKYVTISACIAGVSLVFILFYFYCGGPDKSVKEVKKIVRYYSE